MSALGERPAGEWPAWIDDVLHFAPIAELEAEWRSSVAQAIVRVLDIRAGTIEVYNCHDCGAERHRKASA